MQGLNVSAHEESLTADAVVSKVESITRMHTNFVRDLNSQLRKGAWLPRSFTLSTTHRPQTGVLRIAIFGFARNHGASSAVIQFPNM